MSHPNAPDFMVFTGNANPGLAAEIAGHLGIGLGAAEVGRFSDGEVTVELMQNVRARDVFVIQSTCAPTNENLMELLIMTDALRRASARRITAVVPYYGYARQDRKDKPRVPISAKLVASLLETAGADRIMALDLHAAQIQGFFDVPVDHLFFRPVMIDHFKALGYEPWLVYSTFSDGVTEGRSYRMLWKVEPDLNATYEGVSKFIKDFAVFAGGHADKHSMDPSRMWQGSTKGMIYYCPDAAKLDLQQELF